MRISVPVRATILGVSFLSLFWLPWAVSLVLIFLSGLVFPPAALALGIVADLLYYPGSGFVWASFEGLVLALLALGVRHFVKTRIM